MSNDLTKLKQQATGGYLATKAQKIVCFHDGEAETVKDRGDNIEQTTGYAFYLTPEKLDDLNKLLIEANHIHNKWMHL